MKQRVFFRGISSLVSALLQHFLNHLAINLMDYSTYYDTGVSSLFKLVSQIIDWSLHKPQQATLSRFNT